jgi:RNA polymerase sigma-70 factor, ECF subfamily
VLCRHGSNASVIGALHLIEDSLRVTLPRAYGHVLDAELLAWSAGGDRRAFDEIVKRHGLFALRVASRFMRDQRLAEDVAQDALLSAWRQAGRFNHRRGRFTTWLYRIVVNRVIDERRRITPGQLSHSFDAIDPSLRVDQLMEHDEQRAAISRALDYLPARQRMALTLVYDENLSATEAAAVLGVSAKAIERLLARARTCLREQLSSRPDFATRKPC